ncbi:hypothetical protein BZA70DRAFT_279439 [Myxozyma melibiosi]|uniref:Proteasome maturation factor UMP1 n=1 Tax=Myxozyma melibiosi TaxID=54550 RepID=A0ABR1F610_9ASCO
MSMRFIPSAPYASEAPKPDIARGEIPALRDHMVAGTPPVPMADSLNTPTEGPHPLQSHLKNWDQTQYDMKLEHLRRLFGAHEPVRRVMELEACKESLPFYPEVLKRADTMSMSGAPGARLDIAQEILLSRDQVVDWEDIYEGNDTVPLDFHSDLERRMRL